MRLHVLEPTHAHFETDTCLVIPIYEESEPDFGEIAAETDRNTLRDLHARKTITGKAQETAYVATPASDYGGILVLGMGKPDDFTAEVMRRAAGKACAVLSANRHGHVVLDAASRDAIPVEAFVEGIVLGQYDFNGYKKPDSDPPVRVDEITVLANADEGLEDLRTGCAHTVLACQNANWARDLANTPPNDLTPQALAAQAQAMAKQVGCECTIFDEDALREHEMRGILAVAQGSAEPPRFIVLEYKPENPQRTIALVGKGITFDTGGISIKSGPGMHEMKFDMCGAAAVLGAMKTIVQMKAPIHMICAVPTADNKPGPGAYVPSDIIRMYNGKTVEVHNTDAEGRMLLADAIAYVEKNHQPDAIVDVATLTGAVIFALGHFAAGLFTNNDTLAAELDLAATASGERLWRFPVWDDYAELLKGTHADLCNIGPRGEAGSITAACFLKEFVEKTPWAHIDIAGTAWDVKNAPYWDQNHATGFGVRLLSQWILDETQENT